MIQGAACGIQAQHQTALNASRARHPRARVRAASRAPEPMEAADPAVLGHYSCCNAPGAAPQPLLEQSSLLFRAIVQDDLGALSSHAALLQDAGRQLHSVLHWQQAGTRKSSAASSPASTRSQDGEEAVGASHPVAVIKQRTLIGLAALHGSVKVLKFLLSVKGADPHQAFPDGHTAFSVSPRACAGARGDALAQAGSVGCTQRHQAWWRTDGRSPTWAPTEILANATGREFRGQRAWQRWPLAATAHGEHRTRRAGSPAGHTRSCALADNAGTACPPRLRCTRPMQSLLLCAQLAELGAAPVEVTSLLAEAAPRSQLPPATPPGSGPLPPLTTATLAHTGSNSVAASPLAGTTGGATLAAVLATARNGISPASTPLLGGMSAPTAHGLFVRACSSVTDASGPIYPVLPPSSATAAAASGTTSGEPAPSLSAQSSLLVANASCTSAAAAAPLSFSVELHNQLSLQSTQVSKPNLACPHRAHRLAEPNPNAAVARTTQELGSDLDASGAFNPNEGLPYSSSELTLPEYSTNEFRMFAFKVRTQSKLSRPAGRAHLLARRCKESSTRPPSVCSQVVRCSKRFAHDWRACPFSHPTENARRRDPREFRYCALACPDYKQVCIPRVPPSSAQL